jgi:hypothetical protein
VLASAGREGEGQPVAARVIHGGHPRA